MSQGLYRTKEEQDEHTRKELLQRGISFWRRYAEEYRLLPHKYVFYLAEKKKAKLNLFKISFRGNKYPEIPFLRILFEDMAIAYLEDMTTSNLRIEVERVQYIIETDYLYNTMKSWLAEAIYLLTHDRKPVRLTGTVGQKPFNTHRHLSAIIAAE